MCYDSQFTDEKLSSEKSSYPHHWWSRDSNSNCMLLELLFLITNLSISLSLSLVFSIQDLYIELYP